MNSGVQDLIVQKNDRIAQLLIIPIYKGIPVKAQAPTLITLGGNKGFGSTNKNVDSGAFKV